MRFNSNPHTHPVVLTTGIYHSLFSSFTEEAESWPRLSFLCKIWVSDFSLISLNPLSATSPRTFVSTPNKVSYSHRHPLTCDSIHNCSIFRVSRSNIPTGDSHVLTLIVALLPGTTLPPHQSSQCFCSSISLLLSTHSCVQPHLDPA